MTKLRESKAVPSSFVPTQGKPDDGMNVIRQQQRAGIILLEGKSKMHATRKWPGIGDQLLNTDQKAWRHQPNHPISMPTIKCSCHASGSVDIPRRPPANHPQKAKSLKDADLDVTQASCPGPLHETVIPANFSSRSEPVDIGTTVLLKRTLPRPRERPRRSGQNGRLASPRVHDLGQYAPLGWGPLSCWRMGWLQWIEWLPSKYSDRSKFSCRAYVSTLLT
jgi:hypothetical protein